MSEQNGNETIIDVQRRCSGIVSARLKGSVQEVLVEEEDASTDGRVLTGRTRGGRTVRFSGRDIDVGSIIAVRLEKQTGLTFEGRALPDHSAGR